MSQVFYALLGPVSAVDVNAAIGIRNRSFFQSSGPLK
jgi:hypothetical protein